MASITDPLIKADEARNLDNQGGTQKSWRQAYLSEAKSQFIFALPMVGMNILQYLLNLVALIVVGHLGKLELAACSLASTMANITGYILLLALASALETFCGQAYGAKQYSMVGVFTQQAIVALFICSIPVAFLWWNMEPLLILMGQNPLISAMAGQYSQCLLPSLFASALTQPLVKFFQAQGETLPMAICQLIALLIHIPLIYLLMWPLGFGFLGAAISTSIAWWINVGLLGLYLGYCGRPSFALTWPSLSPEAINPKLLLQFFHLAIPSALMLCLEYWSFEMSIIFAGMLPNPELQVSVIAVGYNVIYLSWVLPYGFSSAVSTRLANEIGGNRPMAARFAAHVSYSMIFGIMTVVGSVLLYFRREIASVFVSDSQVIESVAQIMPFIAWICFDDGFTAINAGAVRGIGHQHLGAFINLASYYLVGVPTSYSLTFLAGWGVKGLCIGIAAGQGTQVVLLATLVLLLTDWKKEAQKALERVDSVSVSSPSSAVDPQVLSPLLPQTLPKTTTSSSSLLISQRPTSSVNPQMSYSSSPRISSPFISSSPLLVSALAQADHSTP